MCSRKIPMNSQPFSLKNLSPLLLFCVALFLVACSNRPTTVPLTAPSGTDVVTPTKVIPSTTPIPTCTSTVLPTSTATSSPSPTPTLIPTETPWPALRGEEAQHRAEELIRNNANCTLPCWWGIVPGKTSWSGRRACCINSIKKSMRELRIGVSHSRRKPLSRCEKRFFQ